MERNRTVGIGMAVVVLLALAAIVVSTLVRDPVSFEPGTPEATIQSFVAALTDERWTDAREHLDAELRDRCDITELSRVRVDDVSRAVIDDVSISGDSAVVDVTVTHTSTEDPLNVSTWDEQVSFVLAMEAGNWVVDEMSWPYPPCRLDTP